MPSLREIVSIALDVRIYCLYDAGDKAGHQSYPERKGPGVSM